MHWATQHAYKKKTTPDFNAKRATVNKATVIPSTSKPASPHEEAGNVSELAEPLSLPGERTVTRTQFSLLLCHQRSINLTYYPDYDDYPCHRAHGRRAGGALS